MKVPQDFLILCQGWEICMSFTHSMWGRPRSPGGGRATPGSLGESALPGRVLGGCCHLGCSFWGSISVHGHAGTLSGQEAGLRSGACGGGQPQGAKSVSCCALQLCFSQSQGHTQGRAQSCFSTRGLGWRRPGREGAAPSTRSQGGGDVSPLEARVEGIRAAWSRGRAGSMLDAGIG